MRLIDADALKEFITQHIKPVPSKLSEEYPEIAVDELEKRFKEEIQILHQIIDKQPTIKG